MKKQNSAVRLRRFERVVVLLDVTAVVQQDGAYTFHVFESVEKILEQCNEHSRSRTVWGYQLFDPSLKSFSSRSKIRKFITGRPLPEHFDATSANLERFKNVLHSLVGTNRQYECTGTSRADYTCSALSEIISDFVWDPMFATDNSSSSDEERRRTGAVASKPFEVGARRDANTVVCISSIPSTWEDLSRFLNSSEQLNESHASNLKSQLSQIFGPVKKAFESENIQLCFLDVPKRSEIWSDDRMRTLSDAESLRGKVVTHLCEFFKTIIPLDLLTLDSKVVPPSLLWNKMKDLCPLVPKVNFQGGILCKDQSTEILCHVYLQPFKVLCSSTILKSGLYLKSKSFERVRKFQIELESVISKPAVARKRSSERFLVKQQMCSFSASSGDRHAFGDKLLEVLPRENETEALITGGPAWQLLLLTLASENIVCKVKLYDSLRGDHLQAILEAFDTQSAILTVEDHRCTPCSLDASLDSKLGGKASSKSNLDAPLDSKLGDKISNKNSLDTSLDSRLGGKGSNKSSLDASLDSRLGGKGSNKNSLDASLDSRLGGKGSHKSSLDASLDSRLRGKGFNKNSLDASPHSESGSKMSDKSAGSKRLRDFLPFVTVINAPKRQKAERVISIAGDENSRDGEGQQLSIDWQRSRDSNMSCSSSKIPLSKESNLLANYVNVDGASRALRTMNEFFMRKEEKQPASEFGIGDMVRLQSGSRDVQDIRKQCTALNSDSMMTEDASACASRSSWCHFESGRHEQRRGDEPKMYEDGNSRSGLPGPLKAQDHDQHPSLMRRVMAEERLQRIPSVVEPQSRDNISAPSFVQSQSDGPILYEDSTSRVGFPCQGEARVHDHSTWFLQQQVTGKGLSRIASLTNESIVDGIDQSLGEGPLLHEDSNSRLGFSCQNGAQDHDPCSSLLRQQWSETSLQRITSSAEQELLDYIAGPDAEERQCDGLTLQDDSTSRSDFLCQIKALDNEHGSSLLQQQITEEESLQRIASLAEQKIRDYISAPGIDGQKFAAKLFTETESNLRLLLSRKTAEDGGRQCEDEALRLDLENRLARKLKRLFLKNHKRLLERYEKTQASASPKNSDELVNQKAKDIELQVLFRLEIILWSAGRAVQQLGARQPDVDFAGGEQSAAIRQEDQLVKEVCSSLDSIQFCWNGGIFGGQSLQTYCNKLFDGRYRDAIPFTISKILRLMDLEQVAVEGGKDLVKEKRPKTKRAIHRQGSVGRSPSMDEFQSHSQSHSQSQSQSQDSQRTPTLQELVNFPSGGAGKKGSYHFARESSHLVRSKKIRSGFYKERKSSMREILKDKRPNVQQFRVLSTPLKPFSDDDALRALDCNNDLLRAERKPSTREVLKDRAQNVQEFRVLRTPLKPLNADDSLLSLNCNSEQLSEGYQRNSNAYQFTESNVILNDVEDLDISDSWKDLPTKYSKAAVN